MKKNTDMIGVIYKLKPSITSPPFYFNDEGHMDKYLDGRGFEVIDVVISAFGEAVKIRDGYTDWFISVDHVVPFELDNRKVRAHG